MSNCRTVVCALLFFCFYACNEKQLTVTSGTIEAGKLQVYYERQGSGAAIVLLHAGLQDHTMWKEQVKEFAKHYDVITLDLPFHGATTGTDTNLLAQDVIKIVLDSLHIKKASIAGLSMGASVTQDFIIAYPKRVNKAFLISSGVNGYDKDHPVDSVSMDWYFKYSAALEAKDTAKAATEFTKAWAEGIYRSGDSLKAPASQYVYATTLATLKLHKAAGWPKLKDAPPAIEKLATVSVPVLIINGDKDLPYITATSNYLAKNLPGAKHIVIKDVAHMLNMEKPVELNRLMMEFMKAK